VNERYATERGNGGGDGSKRRKHPQPNGITERTILRHSNDSGEMGKASKTGGEETAPPTKRNEAETITEG
jgi:hypothetical protein